MGKRVHLLAMVAVGLIISVVVFGVGLALLTPSGGGSAGVPTASEATDAYTSLSGLAATRVTTVRYANGTERTTRTEIRLRPASDAVHVSWRAPAAVRGRLVALNESGTAVYDPDRERVRRSSRTRSAGARVAYRNFLDGAFTDDTDATGVVVPSGTAPVPVLPGPTGETDDRFTFESVREVAYRGNATVRGYETLVLELGPTEGDRNLTVWLEREHFVPVKVRRVVGNGSDRRVTTVRHTDIEFDPGFDASSFRIDPPSGTTVARPDDSSRVESFDSVAHANASAPFPVPDPDPPSDLRFGKAQLVRNETRPVLTMQYRPQTVTNESSVLLVTKAPVQPGAELDRETANDSIVTVAGQPAVYSPDAGGRFDLRTVRWHCDGYAYSVVGRANRSTVLTMAERIGCQ
jgi:outer membrane lipoprotein-sorting protein